jgi:hypothetical protein
MSINETYKTINQLKQLNTWFKENSFRDNLRSGTSEVSQNDKSWFPSFYLDTDFSDIENIDSVMAITVANLNNLVKADPVSDLFKYASVRYVKEEQLADFSSKLAEANELMNAIKPDELKVQTMMYARDVYVECPNCHKMQDGFFGNPAGSICHCVDCNKQFKIHDEADIEHQ